jgi:hypothetical protein
MNTVLECPENFVFHDGFGRYRPIADVCLDRAVSLVDDVLEFCRSHNIGCLLVDVTELSGFSPPSLADRFWIISGWAEKSKGRVVISVVAPAELIQPDKIGVTIAANRGLCMDVFTEEADAIKWLHSQCNGRLVS